MQNNQVPTYYVQIHIAGDIAQAKHVCRKFCRVGLCVTVTPTTYIYTGGEEEGVTVRLINYPRFSSEPMKIWDTAVDLAEELRDALCQHSYTLEAPDRTYWNTIREE